MIHIVMVKTVVEFEDCCKKTDNYCSEVVSSTDSQRLQVDLDFVLRYMTYFHLLEFHVDQDMHEADQKLEHLLSSFPALSKRSLSNIGGRLSAPESIMYSARGFFCPSEIIESISM
ncbi:hypothetical protein Tco_0576025 [Tanacetum coccineum]